METNEAMSLRTFQFSPMVKQVHMLWRQSMKFTEKWNIDPSFIKYKSIDIINYTIELSNVVVVNDISYIYIFFSPVNSYSTRIKKNEEMCAIDRSYW